MDREAKIEQATRLLTHYFGRVYEELGLTWNGDNLAEMRGIVELIVEAAKS